MAQAPASFQPATKDLERMKDESRLNTAHGNGAGLRCAEARKLFQAVDQRSGGVSERAWRVGWNEKRNNVPAIVWTVIKSDFRVNLESNSSVICKRINNCCHHE